MIPMEVHITIPKALEQNRELKELYEADSDVKKILDIAIKLEGLPRQASTHACGIMVFTIFSFNIFYYFASSFIAKINIEIWHANSIWI